MRFTNIVLAYFIIGVVMWGGGAIVWSETGVAGLLINSPNTGTVEDETATRLESLGGPIQEAAAAVGGTGLLAAWNVLVQLIGFLFWPITTLQSVNAPPRVWVLFGGTPTAAFYATLIRTIRSSA